MSVRNVAFGAASVLALVSAVLLPTAAHAAPGDCAVDLKLPAKVVLDSQRETVAVKLNSSPASCVKRASYELVFEGSSSQGVINFNGAGGSYLDVPASNGAGEYTANFAGGTDKDGDALAGKDTKVPMVAKLGARSTITSSVRSGKKVTFQLQADQYNTEFGDYDDAKGTRVQVQANTGFGWTTVKTVTTDRKGFATTTVNAKTKSALKWRAIALENGEHWKATSRTVKR